MLIYKQYDKTALDRQYNNRLQVPDYAAYFSRWETMSRQTEKEHTVHKDIAYGTLSRERLDIYPSAKPHSKTLIFIHGGYWHKLDKELFHFVARSFVRRDITTVLITYPMAPAATMDQVVLSCRNALHWIHKNMGDYNGNPEELYIAGHSAGGHLAAMMMAADWCHFNPRFPAGMFKGVCTISSLFNLHPIRLSELNDVLHMDDEIAMRNSPVELCPVIKCPLLVAVGEEESDEFKEQSEEIYNCWSKEGVTVQLMRLPGINHYSIADAFADAGSDLHREMLKIMRVT